MNQSYIENFIKAGKLAKEVRAFGKSLIRKGASYNSVILDINKKILELGAKPAFPPQISLNEVAAHFLLWPGDDLIFSDQVVKLDVGICYEGAIGDCAVTIDLSGRNQHLIDAAEAALLAAEQEVKVGNKIRNIGRAIEETIASFGLNPIRNLSGHGLGYYKIHTPPTIPNYDNRSSAEIKPGMTFAIEPFATDGKGWIFELGRPAIFAFMKKRSLHSEICRFLMGRIKDFQGLPFSIHDLVSGPYSLKEIEGGVDALQKAKVIAGYPPLVEEGGGLVAQAENSILVDLSGEVLVTTR